MNKPILTLIAILLNLAVGQSQTVHTDLKGKASVKFISSEQNLLFYSDDTLIGISPEFAFAIIPGYHKLRVSHGSADMWAAVDWEWEGILESDSLYTFEIASVRFTLLNSVPYGAKVIINGDYVGTTPFLLEKTTEAVDIVMSNYMPIRLEPSQLAEKNFINIKLVNELPAEEVESIQLSSGIADKRDKIITRSTYLVTALSGIAAVYFKFEADKAFKEFPNAILLEDQIYLKNRIKKYDDLAAVSFGTFQIGFLYSIYRVIRH